MQALIVMMHGPFWPLLCWLQVDGFFERSEILLVKYLPRVAYMLNLEYEIASYYTIDGDGGYTSLSWGAKFVRIALPSDTISIWYYDLPTLVFAICLIILCAVFIVWTSLRSRDRKRAMVAGYNMILETVSTGHAAIKKRRAAWTTVDDARYKLKPIVQEQNETLTHKLQTMVYKKEMILPYNYISTSSEIWQLKHSLLKMKLNRISDEELQRTMTEIFEEIELNRPNTPHRINRCLGVRRARRHYSPWPSRARQPVRCPISAHQIIQHPDSGCPLMPPLPAWLPISPHPTMLPVPTEHTAKQRLQTPRMPISQPRTSRTQTVGQQDDAHEINRSTTPHKINRCLGVQRARKHYSPWPQSPCLPTERPPAWLPISPRPSTLPVAKARPDTPRSPVVLPVILRTIVLPITALPPTARQKTTSPPLVRQAIPSTPTVRRATPSPLTVCQVTSRPTTARQKTTSPAAVRQVITSPRTIREISARPPTLCQVEPSPPTLCQMIPSLPTIRQATQSPPTLCQGTLCSPIVHQATPQECQITPSPPIVCRATPRSRKIRQITLRPPTVHQVTQSPPMLCHVTPRPPTIRQATPCPPSVRQATQRTPTVRQITPSPPTACYAMPRPPTVLPPWRPISPRPPMPPLSTVRHVTAPRPIVHPVTPPSATLPSPMLSWPKLHPVTSHKVVQRPPAVGASSTRLASLAPSPLHLSICPPTAPNSSQSTLTGASTSRSSTTRCPLSLSRSIHLPAYLFPTHGVNVNEIEQVNAPDLSNEYIRISNKFMKEHGIEEGFAPTPQPHFSCDRRRIEEHARVKSLLLSHLSKCLRETQRSFKETE